MKKTFSVLLLSVILLLQGVLISAEGLENPKRNLIDLTNLVVKDYQTEGLENTRKLEMVNPVNVSESQEWYTFIIGREFFTDDYFQAPNQTLDYLYIDWGAGIDSYKLLLAPDGNHFYAFFGPESNSLRIDHVMIFDKGLEFMPASIMLYAGKIEDFTKIYSSKSNLTPEVGYYLMDYDHIKNPTEIIAELSVNDETSDVSNNIIITEDDFTPNKSSLGEYVVRYEVYDSVFNTSIFDVYVKLVDITAPIIKGTNNHTIELGIDTLTIEDIKALLSVSDNYDNYLSNSDLVLLEDTFSENLFQVGTYKVVYELSDSSFNKSTYQVDIEVVDTTSPVIDGPLEVFRYTTDSFITLEEIKSYFSAYDIVDGDVSSAIVFEGEYLNLPGRYPLKISVNDSSNNIESKTIYVNVVDGIPPEFTTSEMIISFEELNLMDDEAIKTWLSNKLMVNAEAIEILLNESKYTEETKSSFVYYSFEKDNQLNYGRIIVKAKTSNILPAIIGISVIILNIGFILIYYKKHKF
ncbi:MAG: hypothetical protein PHD47_01825 [Acholeplasmataceae bacterium]|nr:hypothetical protein [Acholeplasmataceae bacterium]